MLFFNPHVRIFLLKQTPQKLQELFTSTSQRNYISNSTFRSHNLVEHFLISSMRLTSLPSNMANSSASILAVLKHEGVTARQRRQSTRTHNVLRRRYY